MKEKKYNFKDIQKIGDNRQNLSKRRNTAIKKRIKERNRQTMERYKRFSDEQISVANQVNLVEYLRQQGETLTKSGKDMRWNRYTSVTIRGNQYYKWKTQEGGYPIQFLKEFYGYNFKQAMELLSSFANDTGMIVDVHPEEEVKKEFIMP